MVTAPKNTKCKLGRQKWWQQARHGTNQPRRLFAGSQTDVSQSKCEHLLFPPLAVSQHTVWFPTILGLLWTFKPATMTLSSTSTLSLNVTGMWSATQGKKENGGLRRGCGRFLSRGEVRLSSASTYRARSSRWVGTLLSSLQLPLP